MAPFFPFSVVNHNMFRDPHNEMASKLCMSSKSVVIGKFETEPATKPNEPPTGLAWFYRLALTFRAEKNVEYDGGPMSSILFPLFSSFEKDRTATGVMLALVHWGSYFGKQWKQKEL